MWPTARGNESPALSETRASLLALVRKTHVYIYRLRPRERIFCESGTAASSYGKQISRPFQIYFSPLPAAVINSKSTNKWRRSPSSRRFQCDILGFIVAPVSCTDLVGICGWTHLFPTATTPSGDLNLRPLEISFPAMFLTPFHFLFWFRPFVWIRALLDEEGGDGCGRNACRSPSSGNQVHL